MTPSNKTGWRRGGLERGCSWLILLVGLGLCLGNPTRVWASAASMPFAPPSSDETWPRGFSFVVYGDIQDNYRNGHRALVEQISREPGVALVVNTGDISPDKGKNYDRHFFPSVQKIARQTPFFPSLGNHDIEWGSPESRLRFRNFFAKTFEYLGRLPPNRHLQPPTSQKLWYSLVYGNALFIVLDSNLFIDEGKYLRTHAQELYRDFCQEQLRWTVRTLERYRDDPGIRARFVFFHHSPFVSHETVRPFNLGGHPGHSRMMINQKMPNPQSAACEYLLDLFRLHRVTAVFSGHEHYYERWREVILEDGHPRHHLNWVVTGMGGVKPRGRAEHEIDEIDELVGENEDYQYYLTRISRLNPRWTARLEHAHPNDQDPSSRFHNYVLVHVDGAGVRFETKDVRGEVRDSGVLAGPLED